MTVEMFSCDFQSTVNGDFLNFLFFNYWCPVFCGTVFLLDYRLFAFTLHCFAMRVWGWDGNGNNPMGTSRKWK